MKNERIVVLDFGGQYNQLIARCIREAGVFAEILPYDTPLQRILEGSDYQKTTTAQTLTLPLKPSDDLKGIVLTGGPDSVYLEESLRCSPEIFNLGVPVLGICYGMQIIAYLLGGHVGKGTMPEFGHTEIQFADHPLLAGLSSQHVWMNHNDSVLTSPPGFVAIAGTAHCPIAGFADDAHQLYGLQFI